MAPELVFERLEPADMVEGQGKLHQQLDEYLQPTSTKEKSQVKQACLDFMDREYNEPDQPSYQVSLWQACIHQAEQIPYHHQSLVKFARLVAELLLLPEVDINSLPYSLLSWNQGPKYAVTEKGSNYESVESAVRRETNGHAFVALLSAQNLPLHYFLPLSRLKVALEMAHPDDRREAAWSQDTWDKASVDVAVAAVWILYDGHNVYQRCRLPELSRVQLRRNSGGERLWIEAVEKMDKNVAAMPQDQKRLAPGVANYSLRRWRFWAQRFSEMSVYTEMDKEARGLASRAANHMKAIDDAFSGL